jgi:transposase-like protein
MTVGNRTRCPHCGSDASYRYGKAINGKRRRLCLVCDRQYVVESQWEETPNRPICEDCRRPMHVYARRPGRSIPHRGRMFRMTRSAQRVA